MTAQELIAKVLECEGWPSEIRSLARIAQKAIDQRNDEGTWIQSGDPRERWKKYDAELDRIAKGEE